MEILKKYAVKIILSFILIISAALCIYTTYNYNSGANNENGQNSFGMQGNQMSDSSKPMQKNQGSAPPTGNQNGNGDMNNMPQGNSQPQGNNSNQGNSVQNGNMPQGKNMQKGNMGQAADGFRQGGNSSTSSYLSPILISYGVIFLAVFIAAFYFFINKKIKIEKSNVKFIVFTLLMAGLLFRISLGTVMQGYSGDINLFKSWATSAANSLSKFYSSSKSSDYPPLYIYVLAMVGKIASIGSMSKYYILLLKLPSILADVTTSYLIYKIAKKHLSLEMSILLAAFYIFNPAIFINSTLWGQVDSFFTLIVISAVYMLSQKKLGFATLLFTLGVLMKPQGIIFLPVLFFELVKQRKIKSFLKAAVIAIIAAIAIILPFSINKDPLWIFKLYSSSVAEYPYASLNAFNFFSLIGANHVKDTSTLFLLSYHNYGMIFIVLVTLFSWYIYIKGKDSTIAAASALIIMAGVFTFSVGMHERYLFPAIALSILSFIYLKDKRILLLTVGFSITSYLNTHAVLFQARSMDSLSYSPMVIIVSAINVLLFGYLVMLIWDIVLKKKTEAIAI